MTVLWFEGRTGIEDVAELFGCSNEEAYEKLDKMKESHFELVDPSVIVYSDSEISDDELEWIGHDIGSELVSDDDCTDLVSAMNKAKLINDKQTLKLLFYIVKARV
jgi:predicted hydrocarbon binding protein